MTCNHLPMHPMAPATWCRKCTEVIKRDVCLYCKGTGVQDEDNECDECFGTGKGAWVVFEGIKP